CRHRHLAARHRRDAGGPCLHRRQEGGHPARAVHRGGLPEDGRRLYRAALRARQGSRGGAMPGFPQAAALAQLCPARLAASLVFPKTASADPPGRSLPVTVGRICAIIEREADRNGIPREFFARLIFKESRFDPGAVSPAGAEGIAQFMPGTAAMRGLDDSFDIDKALPASAEYLDELKTGFGNLGLAAAAYNAGEARVSRWLSSGGFLPLETENYV